MDIRECIGCREIKEIQERNLCSICVEWEKKHHEKLEKEMAIGFTCSQCGYEGIAIDLHHIHGRKNSDITIRVCCNCHREIHRGTRMIK
jgi:hypothetical protein